MKEVEIIERGDMLVAYIRCEIDHHTAKKIREHIDGKIKLLRPANLILNFSEVDFMDSSGIGLILGRVTELQRIGASLSVEGLSEPHIRILRMAGIEKIKGVKLKGR